GWLGRQRQPRRGRARRARLHARGRAEVQASEPEPRLQPRRRDREDQRRSGGARGIRDGGQASMKRALLFLACLSLSCKVQLTPESISKSWHAYQDAKKDLTPENEYYVGRSVATNLLSRADYKYVEAEDWKAGKFGTTTAYVNAVGNVLAASAMGAPRKDDRPSPIAGWHFI